MKFKMRQTTPEIIIIGATILDVLVRPADADVFETGSSPAEEIRMSVGADALNEATVLAKFGKKVRLETVIGFDRAGDYIVEHCRKYGIELPEDCMRKEIPTGINVVLIDRKGDRHFLTDPQSTLRKLTIEDIHMPFPESAGIVCFASIFVFPKIGPEEMEKIFRYAKEQGKTVCADMTKCKKNETAEKIACALQYVDYLLPNEEEALLLTGKDTAEEAARTLQDAGAGTVVVKCGSRGCYLLEKEKEGVWIPAEEGAVCIDTTGAGDSFAAGFLFALSGGKSPEEGAEYGNRCGARAVGVVGATEWL